jgi:hypothetical protein
VLPDITGGADGVLTGGATGTIALLFGATKKPISLVPVTSHVTDCPTSSGCIVYVELVAPEIEEVPLYHW